MNIDKKVFLNTVYQIAGKIGISFFGLVATAYLARYLGIYKFGEYGLINTLAGLGLLVGDFGLATLLIREIGAKRATRQYISDIFSLRLMLSMIAVFVLSIGVLFFSYSSDVKTGVIIASLGNAFLLLSSVVWAVFQGRLEFHKSVIAQLVTACIHLVSVGVGVYFRFDFLYFIAAILVSASIGFISSIILYRPNALVSSINTARMRKIIKDAWPLGIGIIVSVGYFKIDSLLLSFYYNPQSFPDLGYYTAAYKPFEVMIVFGGYFTQVIFPLISRTIYTKDFSRIGLRYFRYSLLLSVASGVLLYIFAKPVILVMTGAEFLPAVGSLQILSMALGATVFSGFFLAIGLAAHEQLRVLYFSIGALLLNIMLNLLVIPHYSFIGASATTVATQLFILVSNIYIAARVLQKRKTVHEAF